MIAQQKGTSLLAAWISLVSNTCLTVLKIVVGVLFQSQVLIADGVHNGADVIASVATLSSMRISNRPADEDHPYGHGKAEVIAAGIVSVLLAIASILIAFESVMVILSPAPVPHLLSLIAAVVSLVWKQALYIYTIKIAKQVNSKGLFAQAYDHLADVYASLAAVVGVGLALIGYHFHIPYLDYGDPVAGIIVSVLVLKLALSMGRDSIEVLMEKNVSPEKLTAYETLIRNVEQVMRIDRIRAREHGHYILVDVRVGVPGTLTIQEGHDIGRDIKHSIMEQHQDVYEVLVHLNPWYEDDSASDDTYI